MWLDQLRERWQAALEQRGLCPRCASKGVAEAVKLSCRATWIWLINRLSRFRRHYLQQLCYDYRSFNVRGLLTIGTFNLRLEQAFIELRIAPASPQEATPDPQAHKNLQHCRHIWEFLRQGISEDAHGWAIIGPPGCGKTTLLQHIVLVLAQERQHTAIASRRMCRCCCSCATTRRP